MLACFASLLRLFQIRAPLNSKYDEEFENEAPINGDLRESQSVGMRKALFLQLLLVLQRETAR